MDDNLPVSSVRPEGVPSWIIYQASLNVRIYVFIQKRILKIVL